MFPLGRSQVRIRQAYANSPTEHCCSRIRTWVRCQQEKSINICFILASRHFSYYRL
ncbi:hypothetical protein HanPSC8_Chr16g0710161 [Helianthus annuus]|nr:hypothetical protein HanPSC8_Chr16g0710161 [Helianthus annuus]